MKGAVRAIARGGPVTALAERPEEQPQASDGGEPDRADPRERF
jgi:hypothetical protein